MGVVTGFSVRPHESSSSTVPLGDYIRAGGAERLSRHTLTKEHGIWVFHSGRLLPASATDDMLDLLREERDLANLGKHE